MMVTQLYITYAKRHENIPLFLIVLFTCQQFRGKMEVIVNYVLRGEGAVQWIISFT